MTHIDAILTLCLLAFMSCVAGGFISYWYLNRKYVVPMQANHILALRDMIEALEDKEQEQEQEQQQEIPDERLVNPGDLDDNGDGEEWKDSPCPDFCLLRLPLSICLQFDTYGNQIGITITKPE